MGCALLAFSPAWQAFSAGGRSVPTIDGVALGMSKAEVDEIFGEQGLPIISGFFWNRPSKGAMFLYFPHAVFIEPDGVVYFDGDSLHAGEVEFVHNSSLSDLVSVLGEPDGVHPPRQQGGSTYIYFESLRIGVESRMGELRYKLDADLEHLRREF